MIECERCKGTGWIVEPGSQSLNPVRCYGCLGTGRIDPEFHERPFVPDHKIHKSVTEEYHRDTGWERIGGDS